MNTARNFLRSLLGLWAFCFMAAAAWAQAPVISSISPASGGPGITVTVRGENLLNVTRVTFAGVEAAFTPFLSTRLAVVVPDHALSGQISVTTPAGTAISADSFTFINPNAPVVTGFSPIEGKPGATVQINGDHLATATAVRFNGKNATFNIIAGVLFGTVPLDATSGPITVVTPDGEAASTGSFTVLASSTAPTITAFSPASGTAGSTAVQIQGANLGTVTSVKFNGVTAAFSSFAGTIIATVPANATTGPISLTSPTGTATSASSFTVTSGTLPTISSFSPTSGPTGTAITISGSNLGNATAVRFAGFTATFSVFGNSLLATVPASAITGPLTVVTPSGSFTTPTLFTVTAAAASSISDFTPLSGAPGTAVEIHGTSLAGATAVDFNGTAATFSVLGSAVIATVPAAASSGPISIVTSSGKVSSAASFTVVKPVSAQVVSGFTPASGAAGTVVEIRGTNLTGITAVKFNSIDAAFTNILSSLISAVVPVGAASGPITVISPTATNITSTSFMVTNIVVVPLPVITSFTPTNGLPGTSVTITGTNFTGTTEVRFNGVAAAFNTVTVSNLVAIAPTNAQTGPITISTPVGTGASEAFFEVPVLVPPQITSFSPAAATAGTLIEIQGNALTNVTSVRFNGTPALFTPVSATLLTATVPAGITDGPIQVATLGGEAASTATFHLLLPPSITAFTPSSATAGVAILIQGANFSTVTSVKFNGVESFFKVASPTSITAAVPANATTGKITVTNPDGTASSTANIEITLPIPPPVITSFTPASAVPGTVIEIHGSGFANASSVRFNGTASFFTLVSSTVLTAVLPTTATDGLITVTTPGGQASSATPFHRILIPSITGFTPAKALPGTIVTIQGANLSAITSLKFNGAEALFKVDSATSISTAVPANATTGKVTVISPDGTASSPTNFEVIGATPPTPPTLTFTALDGRVEISWPDSSTGFVLEESSGLGDPAAWKATAISPVQAGGFFTASIPSVSGIRFFRLTHP